MKTKRLNIWDTSDKLWQDFYAETKGKINFADYLLSKFQRAGNRLPGLSDPPLGFKTLIKGVR